MKKKLIITLSFACFTLLGLAQTAVTTGKTPASEPAKNDTTAAEHPATQKVVSMSKNASTDPAPQQQAVPAAGEEKTTSGRKKPE
ncbi:MAG: hypothetical protein JWP12_3854 [Bacteroidetes bacterium]|nr:hypothetical protein [Bacteroidota bacterium]